MSFFYNEKEQEEITPEYVEYIYAQKWNGSKVIIDGGGSSIINIPKEVVTDAVQSEGTPQE